MFLNNLIESFLLVKERNISTLKTKDGKIGELGWCRLLNELLMININKCRWRVQRARDQQTNSRGDNAAMCPELDKLTAHHTATSLSP